MFRKIAGVAIAALLVCAAGFAAPLEAYGRLPTLTNLTLSPDGTSLAYVQGIQSKRVIVTLSLANHQVLGMLNVGDNKVRDLQWADNHTVLITTSVTAQPLELEGHKREWFMAQAYDVQTKSARALLDDPGGVRHLQTMNVVTGALEPRIIGGHTVVFVRGIYFVDQIGYRALFRIDLTNNTTRMVSRNYDTNAEDWIVDDAGNIVAESSYYEREQRWKLSIFRDGDHIDVLDVPAEIDSPGVAGLNEDGTAVIVGLPQADGSTELKEVTLKDGHIEPWLRAGLSFGGPFTDERSGRVIGGTRTADRHDYVFFDPHVDVVWRSVKGAFPDAYDVDLVSWSVDRSIVLAHVFGPAQGNSYAVIDMTKRSATRIGTEYSDIDQIAPLKWIEYKAADGRPIKAYLTLPLNREAKNLPLIVLPHGGPHARDDPGFDWISQALASRGYAVLQPQFRGSAGFDTELFHAGLGEFGKKMQSDLSDGVRALASQGVIDPQRVCIVGASYGGYAALAGATFDTGVYRCAVSIAGISDVRALLRYWKGPHKSDDRGERFWERFMGVSDLDDPKLDAIEPLKHAGKASIPILLIHGRDDTRVPFSQSRDMADALKAAKKQVEFVELEREDHFLSRSETRLQMLQAAVKFLEANNPPN